MTEVQDNPIKYLRLQVRGAYELQKLRIPVGLRLIAMFRDRFGIKETEKADDVDFSEDEINVIIKLKEAYKALTEDAPKHRHLPDRRTFKGNDIIRNYSELVLIDEYVHLEQQEDRQFRQLKGQLKLIPIYNEYLSKQVGVGPAMAAIMLAYFDIHRARHMSVFWSYSGLDVGPDGKARSRREEHLVEREYINANGQVQTRKSITYNAFLRTKLLGVLAGSFLRSGSRWRRTYDNYKHRLVTDPNRVKCSVEEYKRLHAKGVDVDHLWTPGRIDKAAKRYMVKWFLADFWTKWRTLEGLEVTASFGEAKMGLKHPTPHMEIRRKEAA